MKNLIITLVLYLAAFATSCSYDDDTLYGSGNLITETRTINTFTQISCGGVFEVTVTQGVSQSVEITADDNIISKVKTIVSNGKLKLYVNDDYNYRGMTLRANIRIANLNGLINSGDGDMYVHNIENDGDFSIKNVGSGDIVIDGVAAGVYIKNQGSGDIFSFDFIVDDCTIDIEGSGDAKVNCLDNLDVDIKGSGDVYYKGTPTINTRISGSGSIIDDN